MKTTTVVCAVLAGFLLGACTQSKVDVAAEESALRAAADAYHEAGASLDTNGFANSYTSSGVILAPNETAMTGRDAALAFISEFAETPGASVSFSNMSVEVAASGDMAYTLADAVVTVDGPGGQPIKERVRDFHLWKKEDGEWKIAVDIWNAEGPAPGAAAATSDPIADALSAAWPGMAAGATVVDWEGNVLQEGANAYTCLPTPPMLSGTAPMCMDSEWMKWADAWQNKQDYAAESLGVSYMLSGDEGASNIDPYAEGPTEDNEWIVEGPHLMILAPAGMLDTFPTDPDNGGPYVMWKGTPYAHLMVPVGARD
jgi:uncharacterized protein (TIGR02246 family)